MIDSATRTKTSDPEHVGSVGSAFVQAARFVVSLVGAGLVCLLIWHLLPASLSVRTDIVGYPTFTNFDANKYYDDFYLVAIAFPIFAAGFYYLAGLPLARLRSPRLTPVFPVTVREIPTPVERHVLDWKPVTLVLAILRAAIPAVVIAAEVSSAHLPKTFSFSTLGIVVGAIYIAVVLALGTLLRRVEGSPEHGSRQLRVASSLPKAMSTVNSLLGLAVVPLLYEVSQATTIAVGHKAHIVHYPWFPLWLAVVASVALAWWTISGLRAVRGQRDPGNTEAQTLTIVVGSVAVFLGTAHFPGALGAFSGFDDSQFLAAPQLIFGHGLLPWSQVLPFHGLLFDVFGGAVGMFIFGNNRWGVAAGQQLLLLPVTWVSFYLMGAYFLRRRPILVVALFLAIVLEVFGSMDWRWLLVPLAFVGLDLVLRKRSAAWAAAFTVGVLVQAIIVPETDLIDAILLIAVFGFELVTRHPDISWRQNFVRTTRCVVSGGVFLLGFAGYLIGTHSLGAFYDYYLAVAPGHNLEGAHPIGHSGFVLIFTGQASVRYTVEFLLPVALVLLTAWLITSKLRRRTSWDPAQWVMVAAALSVVAYFDEALARADSGHVAEMFLSVLPLLILWIRESANVLDLLLQKTRHYLMNIAERSRVLLKAAASVSLLLPVVSIAVLVTTVIAAPLSMTALRYVPRSFSSGSPAPAPKSLPRLGYTVPGSVDTVQLDDLNKVITTYAGSEGPIFDFNNEPGVLYYLLNRVPGTRFDIVSAALTATAQNLLVNDLKKSRPRLVLFTDNEFGLSAIDGYDGLYIYMMVEMYDVSQYLLNNYRPIVSIQGQVLMLRDDLFGKVPPLPHLKVAPVTSNLYYSLGTCAWGYSPNFLYPPVSTRQQKTLRLNISKSGRIAETLTGWVADDAPLTPAIAVVAIRGNRVVATGKPDMARTDVAKALGSRAVLNSGFSLSVPPGKQPLALLAVNSDGTASPVSGHDFKTPANLPSSIRLSDGETVKVVPHHDYGNIDGANVVNERVLRLHVPLRTDLSNYEWITVSTTGGSGHQQFTLSNAFGNPTHEISWWTLPRGGSRISVEVGSCLQWHGFAGSSLSLVVGGSGSVRSVKLTT